MGSTPEPVMDPEARRRARETLFSQLKSLDARLDEAGKAAVECVPGWGVATAIAEAQTKLDWAMERVDSIMRHNP